MLVTKSAPPSHTQFHIPTSSQHFLLARSRAGADQHRDTAFSSPWVRFGTHTLRSALIESSLLCKARVYSDFESVNTSSSTLLQVQKRMHWVIPAAVLPPQGLQRLLQC